MNWKPLVLSALVALPLGAHADDARSVIEERNELMALTQQLERLKTELDIEKTEAELAELRERAEKQKARGSRVAVPEPSAGMTPEMIRREIEAAKQELAQQARSKPRDSQLDQAFIEEAYQPQGGDSLEAILNVNGRLIKVQEGSVIGDWRVKSIDLGRIEVFNKSAEEHMILGDGSSTIATKQR